MSGVNGTAVLEDQDVAARARARYLESAEAGNPLSDRKLAEEFGFSRRWGTYRIEEATGQRVPGKPGAPRAETPSPDATPEARPRQPRPKAAPAPAVPVAQAQKLAAVRRFVTADVFWPRVAILVGVGWTITMNVTAGVAYGPGSALLAATIPAAFVIALEVFIKMIRKGDWAGKRGKVRAVVSSVPLLVAAGITGVVSWLHGHQVCLWTHNADPEAMLIPFLPDLLIVCGTVALVVVNRNRKAGAP